MKKLRWILLTLGLFLPLTACGTGSLDTPAAQSQINAEPTAAAQTETQSATQATALQGDQLYLTVGKTTFVAEFADNSSAEALKDLLSDTPLTLQLHDYGNFEKVGNLGHNLLRNDEPITTEAGDLILYQGNQFSIYYAENSWNFTRLGKIQNVTADELKAALGTGDVTVTLSLTSPAA